MDDLFGERASSHRCTAEFDSCAHTRLGLSFVYMIDYVFKLGTGNSTVTNGPTYLTSAETLTGSQSAESSAAWRNIYHTAGRTWLMSWPRVGHHGDPDGARPRLLSDQIGRAKTVLLARSAGLRRNSRWPFPT
jgi:hypothetical protein